MENSLFQGPGWSPNLTRQQRHHPFSTLPTKSCSQATSTLSCPQGRTVKHTAKRTPQNRLIQALISASGPSGAAKVQSTGAPAASAKAPEAAPVVRNGLAATSKDSVLTVPGPPAQPLASEKRNPRKPLPSSPTGRAAGLLKPKEGFILVARTAKAPRVTAEERRLSKVRDFDTAAFDAVIYQQPAAMKPPPGVSVPARPQTRPSPSFGEDRRLYIHANPAIHLCHNRSEEWHREKALEIQARGGRKAWFGKVIERQRWLRAQQQQRRASTTPHPWSYSWPLDFGEVPEAQLLEDVQQNIGWLKACAWHRETERRRVLRRRESRMSEVETQQFYRNVMAGISPTSER